MIDKENITGAVRLVESPRIKVGDIVALKGSGPTMCVRDAGDWEVTCNWFAGYDLMQESFARNCLRIVPEEEREARMDEWEDR